jgi:hypothetical protein
MDNYNGMNQRCKFGHLLPSLRWSRITCVVENRATGIQLHTAFRYEPAKSQSHNTQNLCQSTHKTRVLDYIRYK